MLKAAIAKYGKNQWYVQHVGSKLPLTAFQGPHFLAARPQDSEAVQGSLVRMARSLYQEDGMVQGASFAFSASPRYSHASHRPRTRSCCILQSLCQRNGVPLPPSSGGQRPSVWSATRSCWTRRRQRTTRSLDWPAQKALALESTTSGVFALAR